VVVVHLVLHVPLVHVLDEGFAIVLVPLLLLDLMLNLKINFYHGIDIKKTSWIRKLSMIPVSDRIQKQSVISIHKKERYVTYSTIQHD
jgi:hypothetical protein